MIRRWLRTRWMLRKCRRGAYVDLHVNSPLAYLYGQGCARADKQDGYEPIIVPEQAHLVIDIYGRHKALAGRAQMVSWTHRRTATSNERTD